MLVSSACACAGQLFWKLSAQGNTLLNILIGFTLYGIGAMCMILALRFGDLSALHPMLGIGYVFSIGLGYLILGEIVNWKKVTGIVIILFGLVQLSRSGKEA